ncbi:hypothetical protein XI08_11655 [Bradyrhizobium sp. CCBAU 11361]|nr:hypothetical protein [Bradyrhizobium sp. CCBAU 11361]
MLRHAFEFRDQTPEHCTLLRWKRQTVQPMLSALAEEISFVGRDEVGMQDSLHASFNPDDLRQDASALGHLAPAAVGVLVSNPDLRQEAGSMQLCQGPSIDLVRFDSRIGDRPNEPRIGDRDALNVRAQNTFDRRAVARHLDDHLILEAECLGKGDKPIVDEIYAELSDYCSVLQDRHLGERSVDVHADDLHA